ncbi:hypothetical protein [Rhizobium halophilum]|uniref:hypothetical protein n=1 Tax=Rhizobium halophilum TaxID=2846852 RepID=UPI001EFD7440|nr:hypothetical protein [Rhizobium halophilum]MCF6367967.1 hypothetical protein [Rhizobium halophilum]
MSRDEHPSGGYRNDGLRSERDPEINDGRSQKDQQTDPASPPGELPEVEYAQNEMSKAWARDSYRADYGRASEPARNDFGRKRVPDAGDTPERK